MTISNPSTKLSFKKNCCCSGMTSNENQIRNVSLMTSSCRAFVKALIVRLLASSCPFFPLQIERYCRITLHSGSRTDITYCNYIPPHEKTYIFIKLLQHFLSNTTDNRFKSKLLMTKRILIPLKVKVSLTLKAQDLSIASFSLLFHGVNKTCITTLNYAY